MADVKFYEWDWPGAEEAYQQSIALNPNNSEAYTWYASFLSAMGRTEEALSMSQKSLELAPLSIGPYFNGIIIRVDAGMFDEAESLMIKAKELFPAHPVSYGIEGQICIARGNYQQALKLYRLARLGNKNDARAILDSLINKSPDHYISPLQIALVYLALDKKDQFFLWLNRAYIEHAGHLPYLIKTSFLFNEIRPDPRFQELLKRMKLDK